MKLQSRALSALAVSAAAMMALSACGGGGGNAKQSADADGITKLSIGGLPDNTKVEERKAFVDEIAEFESINTDIKIEASEYLWDQQTFSAQLAGGTLPTLMDVPFGEMKGLIERDQIKNLNEFVGDYTTISQINDSLLEAARGKDGDLYGVPVAAYSIGLVINRDLFQQAGIDPDKAFANWDEMADAAKKITAATGKRGFEHPATENYGGWLLSAMAAGFGSKVEVENADGTFAADLEAEGVKQSLEFIHKLRWELDVMGTNALPSSGDVNNNFATGDVAMIITGADAYQSFTVTKDFPKENYGTLPLPQASNGLGTLGGGRIAIIRPDATDTEVNAALKWTEFHTFKKFESEESAVTAAKASEADGLPVPAIGMPLISSAQWDEYMTWIEPYVNVPMENLAPYLDSAETMPIVPEPMVAAGDLFAILDTSIQGVLGRQDADIAKLLSEAQVQAEQVMTAAQK